jgi:fengycin family lipopeptide synthetase D
MNMPNSARQGREMDEMELYLIDLWKRCLGVPDVALNDDFFGLGGASMTSIVMLLTVSEFYKCEFDFEAFYVDPCIRHLSELLRSGSSATVGE